MKRVVLSVAVALLLPVSSWASPIWYTASLSGAGAFPPNPFAPASGGATVIYDDVLHTLYVTTGYSSLFDYGTAAHLHCCVSASAAIPLAGVAADVPSFTPGRYADSTSGFVDVTRATSFDAAFLSANGGTAAGAEAALAAGLASGFAYIDIHSNVYPDGAIRGFLSAPEPAASALCCVALGALLALRASPRRD